MIEGHRIFIKVRLRPSQLRTVAGRRYADAMALLETRQNERSNGAMYLAGFVIECLLKAKLLERYPWLQTSPSPDRKGESDKRLWSLCYRLHNLDEILVHLPEFESGGHRGNAEERARRVQNLKIICAHWTIFARYSPYAAMMTEADEFLTRVKELKEWLK